MTLEERLEQTEKRNKRLMTALTLMAVAVCAVVTLAATNVRDVSNSEIGRWDFHSNHAGGWPSYLLDSKTGDLWEVKGSTKKGPVKLKK